MLAGVSSLLLFYLNELRKMILLRALYLLLLASVVVAKFEHFYSNIADAGLQACIANSNFTRETVTQKENCREVFQCVIENTQASWQVILSSASAVLGFVSRSIKLHHTLTLF